MSLADELFAVDDSKTQMSEFRGKPVLLRSLTMKQASIFSSQTDKWTPMEQYFYLCKCAMLDPDTKEPILTDAVREAFDASHPGSVMAVANAIVKLSGIGPDAVSDAGKGSDATTSST